MNKMLRKLLPFVFFFYRKCTIGSLVIVDVPTLSFGQTWAAVVGRERSVFGVWFLSRRLGRQEAADIP